MSVAQLSFEDLGTPLAQVTFCVIDLETTGGDRNVEAITEVGAVKVRGGECMGTFQTLVNPGRAIPPMISVLTGLTDALVAPAPPIDAVLPSLLEFIGPSSVIVGHNVRFDVGFLDAALDRAGRSKLVNTRVDTVAIARRLVRDEVPNCSLGTLASRLRLEHRPTHRALDDALATVDLLHLLIERAAAWGVTGLDDLVALASISAHPQASKLRMTSVLPRSPGVYWFCGPRGDVLYVGKATNLRQRVRSYFGSEDRRRIGPMLRETATIHHMQLPDPLTAEVIEGRMIAALLPRYNRKGTRGDRYCYVRLDTASAWPRLTVVRQPSAGGVHLGPLPSRAVATLVVEAVQSVIPLRRCSTRLTRRYQPALGTPLCTAAQLGVSACPCAGAADPREYEAAVTRAARTLSGDACDVVSDLQRRMELLAAAQRFEEAAFVRDRTSALTGALRRQALVQALFDGGRVEIEDGRSRWVIEQARLLTVDTATLPGVVDPPPAPAAGVLPRVWTDEALCLARYFDRHAHRLTVKTTGSWNFPVPPGPELTTIALSRRSAVSSDS